MLNQFSRTELLIGKEALEKLQKSTVAVFGIGGVGGYVVEALVRSGIGAIDLIDDDKICLTNLNRQLYATRSTVGKFKVDIAEERIKDINPNVKINKYKTFYTPDTKNEFDFTKYDYVIDAIDTVVGKISLIEETKKNNIPIICAMGAGNKMDASKFEVSDISKTSVCPLARVIRQELKKRKISGVKVVYSKEPPIKPDDNCEVSCKKNCICPPGTVRKCTVKHQIPGSNAFCPSVMGLIIAGEVIKDLINSRE
ncbi:tRNA threonylcarbamoyladenosine dehydratase [bacterium]|nr:tRNA threonylcarbamoyladenosine dehydratase [bacterium]